MEKYHSEILALLCNFSKNLTHSKYFTVNGDNLSVLWFRFGLVCQIQLCVNILIFSRSLKCQKLINFCQELWLKGSVGQQANWIVCMSSSLGKYYCKLFELERGFVLIQCTNTHKHQSKHTSQTQLSTYLSKYPRQTSWSDKLLKIW